MYMKMLFDDDDLCVHTSTQLDTEGVKPCWAKVNKPKKLPF